MTKRKRPWTCPECRAYMYRAGSVYVCAYAASHKDGQVLVADLDGHRKVSPNQDGDWE